MQRAGSKFGAGRDSALSIITSQSYYLKEEFLTGDKSRMRKHHSSDAQANILTPAVKIKGVGFEQTPY